MSSATLALPIIVERKTIEQADYPDLLTSLQLTFAILAVVCVDALAASLVRPRGEADGAAEWSEARL
jgi:hypothetical protein